MQNPLELILAREIETGVRDKSKSATKPPLIKKLKSQALSEKILRRKILHKSTTLKVIL